MAWRRHSWHCTTFMQEAECVQAPDNPWSAEVTAVHSIFNDESPAHSTTCLPPIANGPQQLSLWWLDESAGPACSEGFTIS